MIEVYVDVFMWHLLSTTDLHFVVVDKHLSISLSMFCPYSLDPDGMSTYIPRRDRKASVKHTAQVVNRSVQVIVKIY